MKTKKKVNEWNTNKMFIVGSGDSNNFSIIKKLIIIMYKGTELGWGALAWPQPDIKHKIFFEQWKAIVLKSN